MIAKKAEEKIWNRVKLNLWGPATINNKNGKTSMHLMTMIDPVSCWFEVAAIYGDPNSLECQRILYSQWLSRYPRPKEVVCEGGSEFNRYFRVVLNRARPKRGRNLCLVRTSALFVEAAADYHLSIL